jgi:hypothetical protein
MERSLTFIKDTPYIDNNNNDSNNDKNDRDSFPSPIVSDADQESGSDLSEDAPLGLNPNSDSPCLLNANVATASLVDSVAADAANEIGNNAYDDDVEIANAPCCKYYRSVDETLASASASIESNGQKIWFFITREKSRDRKERIEKTYGCWISELEVRLHAAAWVANKLETLCIKNIENDCYTEQHVAATSNAANKKDKKDEGSSEEEKEVYDESRASLVDHPIAYAFDTRTTDREKARDDDDGTNDGTIHENEISDATYVPHPGAPEEKDMNLVAMRSRTEAKIASFGSLLAALETSLYVDRSRLYTNGMSATNAARDSFSFIAEIVDASEILFDLPEIRYFILWDHDSDVLPINASCEVVSLPLQ